MFGTKAELVVPFEEREASPTPDGDRSVQPFLVARYDFVLQPAGRAPAVRS